MLELYNGGVYLNNKIVTILGFDFEFEAII